MKPGAAAYVWPVLIPPPRRHRHRYYRVLAPNAPLRAAVAALAGAKDEPPIPTAMTEPGATVPNVPDEVAEAAHRKAARYVWALLLARIYEVVPLVCPKCGGDMRIIAFIMQQRTCAHSCRCARPASRVARACCNARRWT
jgi:hypothetical protein